MVKKSQIKRLENLHAKLIERGISIKKANKFTSKEWYDQIGGKKILPKDSLEAQKKLLKQISQKQDKVVTYYAKKRGITNKNIIKTLKTETSRLFKLKRDPIKEAHERFLQSERGIYRLRKIKIGRKIYWIKSINDSDYQRQLNILTAYYQKKNYRVQVKSNRKREYNEFINSEEYSRFKTFVR